MTYKQLTKEMVLATITRFVYSRTSTLEQTPYIGKGVELINDCEDMIRFNSPVTIDSYGNQRKDYMVNGYISRYGVRITSLDCSDGNHYRICGEDSDFRF